MKKIKYDDIISLNNIKEAYKIIRRNTRNKDKLFKFELFYSANIVSIWYALKKRIYKHGKYNIFLIREPKYRVIMSECMSDKIVNHLISKYLLDVLISPKLIRQNIATRKNLGTKAGIIYTKKYINKLKINHDKIYVLKCDIKKYFYNIDHEIILNKLAKIIEDKELFLIMKNIINSTDKEYVNKTLNNIINKEINRVNKLNIVDKNKRVEELKRIPLYIKGKGLPIGNMTSQILAIFYLNDLDHFIKEKLYVKYYIRYMDDFIIFDYDKERLKKIRIAIEKKLKEFKLELNNKTNIYDLNQGFNFLGYNFSLKNKRLIIKINNQTKKRIIKKMKTIKKKKNYINVVASYKGYLKQANAKYLNYKIDSLLKE